MMLLLFAGITLCSLAGLNGQDVPACPVEGQVLQECRSCPATCSNPGLICRAVCEFGCGCPSGQLIDTVNNTCVDPEECVVDCAAVQCLKPVCPAEVETIVPPGECCPVCNDSCSNHTCPIGSQCKVYESTGEAYCDPSCNLDNGGCSINQTCSLEIVECARAPCPPVVNCSDVDPCDNYTCPIGSQCEVYEPTGEAFCDPSCDLDNGGCPIDQTCSLETVECVRAPCPPEVNCSDADPCDNYTCPIGSQCEVYKPTGEAYCEPSCDLDNGGCSANQICSLETVECTKAPCPPVVNCSNANPCDNYTCPIGSQCEVYEPTGEAYCNPSCDLDNGGCPAYKTCSLQTVQCVRAPCPPVVSCSHRCPPKCSHEFCRSFKNKFKPCSNPSATNPPCPDQCSTTFCSACYYSNQAVQSSSRCDSLCEYPPSRTSLVLWAKCLYIHSLSKRIIKGKPKDFRCYNYVCPLRG